MRVVLDVNATPPGQPLSDPLEFREWVGVADAELFGGVPGTSYSFPSRKGMTGAPRRKERPWNGLNGVEVALHAAEGEGLLPVRR